MQFPARNPKDFQQPLKAGRGRGDFPLEPSGGLWLCQHLDFEHVASRTVVLSLPGCDALFQPPEVTRPQLPNPPKATLEHLPESLPWSPAGRLQFPTGTLLINASCAGSSPFSLSLPLLHFTSGVTSQINYLCPSPCLRGLLWWNPN